MIGHILWTVLKQDKCQQCPKGKYLCSLNLYHWNGSRPHMLWEPLDLARDSTHPGHSVPWEPHLYIWSDLTSVPELASSKKMCLFWAWLKKTKKTPPANNYWNGNQQLFQPSINGFEDLVTWHPWNMHSIQCQTKWMYLEAFGLFS